MALTFRDYSGDVVEAARSVLLELVYLLGEYREDWLSSADGYRNSSFRHTPNAMSVASTWIWR